MFFAFETSKGANYYILEYHLDYVIFTWHGYRSCKKKKLKKVDLWNTLDATTLNEHYLLSTNKRQQIITFFRVKRPTMFDWTTWCVVDKPWSGGLQTAFHAFSKYMISLSLVVRCEFNSVAQKKILLHIRECIFVYLISTLIVPMIPHDIKLLHANTIRNICNSLNKFN